MRDKNILIISNRGLSNNESNGRILSLLLHNYIDKNKHSYCIGGCLDIKDVHYVKMNDQRNLKSLCSFGIIKPELGCNSNFIEVSNSNNQIKNKKAFHYYLRNLLYSINFHIISYMRKYISDNNINCIFLFGSDAPYLYKLARKLSIKTRTELIIYTCEDYPLKEYNYISRGRDNNIFYKSLHRSLFKQTKKAYKQASKSYFNSNQLRDSYLSKMDVKHSTVKYLPSLLSPIDYKPRNIKNIVYGGNLYHDRVVSLIDIIDALFKIDPTVTINLYGKINDADLPLLKEHKNVKYNGFIKYDELLNIYRNADMLLHMEGFNDYSKLDYKYAFSSKISDCYMLGIPFFMYSPIEIASTKYGLSINPNYVATNKEEMRNKLVNIISYKKKYEVDQDKIENDFSPTNLI